MSADRSRRALPRTTEPALLLGLVFLVATATGLGLHIGQADGWWILGTIVVAAVAYGLVATDESTPIPLHPTRVIDSPEVPS